MPSNNRPFEFVRTRPRRDRDKDRDGDNHSQAGSTIASLKERKHRKSHSSSAPSDGGSTIKCHTEKLEDLPPLPETEESEPASNASSPLMRTIPVQQYMPGSFDTPDNLQPYLEESEEDTMSTINVPNRMTESGEWIGPKIETDESNAPPNDGATPTPMPKQDPLEFLDLTVDAIPEKEKEQPTHRRLASKDKRNKPHVSPKDQDRIYSWAAGAASPVQGDKASQMENPFCNLTMATKRAAVPSTPKVAKPVSPPASMPGAPPRSDQRSASPQGRRPPLPIEAPPWEESHVNQPLIRIQASPVTPSELPPPSDHGYDPGALMTVPQLFSPVPMHHTVSEPLPYPGGPSGADHPANILHRVGSILPDITALMNLYYGACQLLHTRDQQIHELESMRAAESASLNQRIGSLTGDISAMIEHHQKLERRLQEDLAHIEKKNKKLQENHAREIRHRDEARAAHKALQIVHEESRKKHNEQTENMAKAWQLEKERITVVHDSERSGFRDQIAQDAIAAEEALRAAEQRSRSEKEALEAKWHREMQDAQEEHRLTANELKASLKRQQEQFEEERANHEQTRGAWATEREETNQQRNAERAAWRVEAEEQRQSYMVKHRESIESLQKQTDETIARVRTQFDTQVAKLERDKTAALDELEQSRKFHESQIRTANETFRREKEEYKVAMEAATQQRINEIRATSKSSPPDKSSKPGSREPSESRRLQEVQQTVTQLQKQNAELLRARGSSQSRQATEAQELIAKLQKDNEILRGERLRPTRSKGEDAGPPRSSTPAPKEEKLERTRSNRTSGVFSTSSGSSSRREKGEDGHRHHRLS